MNTAEQIQHESFSEAITAHGLTPPDHIEPGQFHRFPGAGKGPSNKAGWCRMFEDGEGGAFGDWSSGLSESWQARKPADEAERKRWAEQLSEARRLAEQQRKQAQAEAAKTAAEIWDQAEPADTLHGYLVAKNVEPHGIRQDGDRLLIPLISPDGEIRSLQRIDTEGNKRFHPGGEVTGNYYLIGEAAETIIIAEGYATAATIFEAAGHPVAVAFNAGNLGPVAKAIRAKHPEARLIIAADDDQETDGNPGISKATDAAQAVCGELATPGQAGDFNDLRNDQGTEAIRQRFEAAEKVSKPGAVDLEMVNISDLERADLPEPEHIIDKLLPVGVASSLAGHGGTGKTFVALTAATCVAAGRRFMGLEVSQAPVVFYSAEDGPDIVRYRLKKILSAEHISPDEIAERLHIVDATSIDPALYIERQFRDEFSSTRRGVTTGAFEALADKVAETGARLIIVDNASDVFEANENERARVRGFIRALASLARETDSGILLLSHVDKTTAKAGTSSEGYSGSTAWHNSVRSRMFLHGDGRNLTLEHQKANLGPLADDVLMHFDQGVLLTGHVEYSSREDNETDLQHLAEILTMIQDRSERANYISTSRTAGNAWTVLSALNGFPKVDRRTFWRLVDQAETAGRLKRETYRDDKRMTKERFSVTEAGKAFCRTAGP